MKPIHRDRGAMQLGVLTDADIQAEAKAGRLIVEHFVAENALQSSYELRAGHLYHDLSAGGEQVRVAADGVDFILLKPNQAVVIKTHERLDVPNDVVGRVLLKGKLFSLGILPVCTYADPGFRGHLGIILHNASGNYIKIPPGEKIAKVEFERFHAAVKSGYRGQHGFGTDVWPIVTHMILPTAEARAHPRYTSFDEETRRAFGDEIGNAFKLMFGYGRRIALAIVAYVGLSVVLIAASQATGQRLNSVLTILLGVLTNLLTSALLFFGTSLRRRKK